MPRPLDPLPTFNLSESFFNQNLEGILQSRGVQTFLTERHTVFVWILSVYVRPGCVCGGSVVQWLALSAHGKKVLGSSPKSDTRKSLCVYGGPYVYVKRVCM